LLLLLPFILLRCGVPRVTDMGEPKACCCGSSMSIAEGDFSKLTRFVTVGTVGTVVVGWDWDCERE
jgi:hypothetical protein